MNRLLSVNRHHRNKNRVKPQFEMLEDRCVPAAYLTGGSLVIEGTELNDSVLVNNYSTSWGTYYQVNFNGFTQYFWSGSVTTGNVFFYGYAGNDHFRNNVGTLHAVAYGGAGNDSLIGDVLTDWLYGQDGDDYLNGWTGNDLLDGGTGNDRIYGGSGTDWCYGGTDNDRIFGGDNYDYCYGQDGNDYIDAGSAGEYVDGGLGMDINAWVWAVGGATYNDVYQGGGPTCWLDSAISSAALHGVNFANRISYLGNQWYRVYLYNTSNVWTYEDVYFDGTVFNHDAQLNPNQEGEFWALLVHRAYLESRGLSTTNAPSGWADGPLQAFMGQAANTYNDDNLSLIINSLNANRNVIADTADSADDLSTNLLVPWHQYTVIRVETEVTNQTIDLGWFNIQVPVINFFVVMRNPWGVDGGSTTWGNANDGKIRVSWSDFVNSMDAIIVC